MKYDFDTVVNRYGTGSVKYDSQEANDMPGDVLPMWVADMDFPAPEEIREKMKSLCDFGIYGYTMMTDEYFEAVKGWMSDRFNWQVRRQWIVTTPGIVFALATAVKAFTQPGDGVLIQQPVYYPFANVIKDNDRVVVNSGLRYEDNRYVIDFEELENKLADDKVKLMIICSPHNPVGRVWTREELERIGKLCIRYNVKMVSDEIHSDFIYGDRRHVPLATVSEDIRENCVVCTAPSKTFNLAGLQVSNIFIANREMRHAFKNEMNKNGLMGVNMMGLCACEAAYQWGGPWLDQLKIYLQDNIKFLKDYIKTKMPLIKVTETEGTYLVWMDLRALNLGHEGKVDQKTFIVNNAKLWLDSGTMFGKGGEGFERINVACPRAVLKEALARLEKAYIDMIGN